MQPEDLKKYFWFLLNGCLAALLVLGVFFAMPAVQRYKDSLYPSRSISVSSQGKSTVTPDVAKVSFSIVSKGKNPEELAENNNEKMNAVIENIKSNGVDAKDIKTTGYDLFPDYRYDENTERRYIIGYTMTQTVSVKIRDLTKVATILGGVTPLGINQISSITFDLENRDKALADARAEAIAKAKEKAKQVAQAAGVKLVKINSVNEYQPADTYRDYGMGGAEIMKAPAAPSIEPGSQEITVEVNINYAIK
ncbi:MAG: SIMPL domain-containing protein [Candidatus Liptonbacteria bacterium]